eukprot:TRINITY_DN3862_c0_g1_i1.p1 TRINITY_DN3862_c0_g1~~TRINITY_DN3862_c0_g1_i1.p1  ORF type:complete len:113 (-),score=1.84 TRINITY_DN3862_c0_g1_i1:30-329(-)
MKEPAPVKLASETHIVVGDKKDSKEKWVNLGYENWEQQRSEWKKKPKDYVKPTRTKIEYDETVIFSEMIKKRRRAEQAIPLKDFARVMVKIWNNSEMNY